MTVGKTFEKEGNIEIRTRRDGQTETVTFESAAEVVANMITAEMATYNA